VTRGILYLVWKGHADPTAALERSIASLERWHPELKCHVQWLSGDVTLLDKAKMLDLSPFDETLFLDADTVVMGDLNYGFQQAQRFGVSLCININPWARRYAGLVDAGETTEYDTGVIFFDKRQAAVQELFQAWKDNCDLDSSVRFLGPDGIAQMAVNDQCSFAHAVASQRFNPWILPVNYNVHPRWQKTIFGPIRILHDYKEVPSGLEKWNEDQSEYGGVIKCAYLP
jgi:hypothetical protein